MSVLAVGTSRGSIDDVFMWVFGVRDFEVRPLPKARSVLAKLLSLLVAALTIIAPSVVVLMAEKAAYTDNSKVNKVVWLSVPAHGWGTYKVLVAMTIHMWPVYDDHGYCLVQASLAMACLAVLVVAYFSCVDFVERCVSVEGQLRLKKKRNNLMAWLWPCFGVGVRKLDDTAHPKHDLPAAKPADSQA